VDVFDFAERNALESSPDLSLYRSLTSDQVIGLLDACGNYFARRPDSEPEELPFTTTPGSDVVAAHRDLVHVYRRVAVDGEVSSSHGGGATFVFSEAEQQSLRLHKYVGGCERITHKQLLDLLTAVHAYSTVAADIPLRPERGFALTNRYFHAHNSVIRFGREPFTDAEFVDDLHETVFLRR